MVNKKRNQPDKIRRVALDGFSGPNEAMLEYCFASADSCELSDPAQAHVLIVNGDQAKSDEDVQWHIKQIAPNAHYVVISVRDLAWSECACLKKPHTAQALLDLVNSFEIPEGNQQPQDSGKTVADEDPALYRGANYARRRKGEALKQKLMRGKLIVNAADRLVKQIEDELKQKQAQAKIEQEAAEQAEQAKAASAADEKLKAEKKRQAAEKVKLLKKKLAAQHKKNQPSVLEMEGSEAPVVYKEWPLSAEEIRQCCGNASDVDMNRIEERRSIFLNPEGSLLVKMTEAVELAHKLEQPVEITGLPGQMFLFPEQRQFYSTFSDDFLNQIALTRFGYGELDLEAKGDFELEEKGKHLAADADSLIWKVALWTARGRLFNGMDPEKPVQLTNRPEFDHFQPLPRCEEISDVWAGHRLSALDVARILDLPQRVVFSFMAGAYSLGWFQDKKTG
ncbi:hypothetical protein [Neptuniibacter halophilus]|uniref:hypothetical protein n=1 Tax=Neptuniibacter halophilus TaxID=651666 RepID=UPI002574367F|nr:hypothetical protein [Neptuniibacter halophilus]